MYNLPSRIQSRSLQVNGLDMHILEAFPGQTETDKKAPLVLLLHGFPELAYSWRKVIIPLADAGYHVVAPDKRGYGRTVGEPTKYEDVLSPYRMLNVVLDVVALTYALGYSSVAAVVGHDFGSSVAGFCALLRPDLFKSVVLMGVPFVGVPTLPGPSQSLLPMLNRELAKLDPPRKHYTMYYSTEEANSDLMNAPEGIHAFLRAYYHTMSADWPLNNPRPIESPTPSYLAEVMPHIYIMNLHETMPETVSRDRPSQEDITKTAWLTEAELEVYCTEYTRTGFQGGLNWYRCTTDQRWMDDLMVFSGKRVEVPAMFLAGRQDWAVQQMPGGVEAMRKICMRMEDEDFVLVDGAGHWVQQERPDEVVEHLMRFLSKVTSEEKF